MFRNLLLSVGKLTGNPRDNTKDWSSFPHRGGLLGAGVSGNNQTVPSGMDGRVQSRGWPFVFLFVFLFGPICISDFAAVYAAPLTIKVATLAPTGSPWHDFLKEVAESWHTLSDGSIVMRIYPGGVAGDDADMVRKIRIGQLQGALITNSGLSRIAPAVNVLVIPMAMDSYEATHRVRDALTPRLDTLLDEKGFTMLNWGDAGIVRFFIPEPNASIEAVRKAKLFIWAGDDKIVELWKSLGFHVVPLAATDILPSLQTGMINAFSSTPILALSSQWFAFTPAMLDMVWGTLVGGTIIDKRTWNKIPEDLQPKLKKAVQNAGDRLQLEIRKLEEDAISEMKKRGLQVVTPTKVQLDEWRQTVSGVYPTLIENGIPKDWFEDAISVAK